MPILYSNPNLTNKINNINVRRLDELIKPIIGRSSQNKVPMRIQADLKRQIPTYIIFYKEKF